MTAILAALVLAASGGDAHTLYQIDVRVTAVRTDAPRAEQRVRVLAEPKVVTRSGRPAFFRVGEVRPLNGGIVGPGVGEQTTGFQIEVLPVQRSGNRFWVETTIIAVGTGRAQRETADVAEGAKLRFRMASVSGHETLRAEVVVAEVKPAGSR